MNARATLCTNSSGSQPSIRPQLAKSNPGCGGRPLGLLHNSLSITGAGPRIKIPKCGNTLEASCSILKETMIHDRLVIYSVCPTWSTSCRRGIEACTSGSGSVYRSKVSLHHQPPNSKPSLGFVNIYYVSISDPTPTANYR